MVNRGVIGKKASETESVAVTGNSVSFIMMTIEETATMGLKTLKKHCNLRAAKPSVADSLQRPRLG